MGSGIPTAARFAGKLMVLSPDWSARGKLRRVLADWCQPYSGYPLFYPSRRRTQRETPRSTIAPVTPITNGRFQLLGGFRDWGRGPFYGSGYYVVASVSSSSSSCC